MMFPAVAPSATTNSTIATSASPPILSSSASPYTINSNINSNNNSNNNNINTPVTSTTHTSTTNYHPTHPSHSTIPLVHSQSANSISSTPPPANVSTPSNHSNHSSKSTPAPYSSNIHSSPSSPKPSALELKARAKGKARATYSPTTGSPLQKQHQQLQQPLEEQKHPSRNASPKISPKKSSTPSSRPTTPPRPSTKDFHLEQYITRDLLHAAALVTQSNAHIELIRAKRREAEQYRTIRDDRRVNPASVFGPGYQGYGNGHTDGPTRILYPCERKRPGNRRSREVSISRKQLKQQADSMEDLVPVRLELDFDKIKLRDTFTWNLHERTIPMEIFAENLIEDFHLPSSLPLVTAITRSIAAQVTDYHPHVFIEDAPLDSHLPYSAYKNDEMRVLIKLNITIGNYTLVDQFEWDINNPNSSPEDFAQFLTRDLSLSGEFTTAIAHSIREQAQLYSKYLYFIGYPFDGRPIEDDDLRQTLLPSPLPGVLRPTQQAKDFSPVFYELSMKDVDQAEKSLSREARKNKRRLNRRGGPALPDLKEIPKTVRSQIVSSVLPGAVTKVSEMRIISKDKMPGESESEDSDSEPPTPQPAPAILATMTRRQRNAAIAASTALRNSAARSATPEVGSYTPHHRISHRDYERRPNIPLGYDSLVVKLRIDREKFAATLGKQMLRSQRPQRQELHQQVLHIQYSPSPIPHPPPQTPQQPLQQPITVVPAWLTHGLSVLALAYPNDRFEGTIRPIAYDTLTGQAVPASNQAQYPSGRLRTELQPRIRCLDCPGKLYTPNPDQTTQNFEVHLKNRGHRERVEARIKGGSGGVF